MLTRLLKYGLWSLAVAALLIVLVWLALNVAVQWAKVRDPMLKQLESITGYEVSVSKLSFSLWPQPHVAAENVRLRPHAGTGEVEADRLTLTFIPEKLLDFQFFPSRIRIYGPRITLHPSGAAGAASNGKQPELPFVWPEGLETLHLFNGRIAVEGRDATIESLNVSMMRVNDKAGLVLNVITNGSVVRNEEQGPFRIFGRMSAPSESTPLREWNLSLFTNAQEWPLGWMPASSAFTGIQGRGSVGMQLQGSLHDGVSLRGEVVLAPSASPLSARGENASTGWTGCPSTSTEPIGTAHWTCRTSG